MSTHADDGLGQCSMRAQAQVEHTRHRTAAGLLRSPQPRDLSEIEFTGRLHADFDHLPLLTSHRLSSVYRFAHFGPRACDRCAGGRQSAPVWWGGRGRRAAWLVPS